jgi:hypothetical protein
VRELATIGPPPSIRGGQCRWCLTGTRLFYDGSMTPRDGAMNFPRR